MWPRLLPSALHTAAVLLPRHLLLQVLAGLAPAGPAVEQVRGPRRQGRLPPRGPRRQRPRAPLVPPCPSPRRLRAWSPCRWRPPAALAALRSDASPCHPDAGLPRSLNMPVCAHCASVRPSPPARYWVNALSSNPLLNTRDLVAGQLADIGERWPRSGRPPPARRPRAGADKGPPKAAAAWAAERAAGANCRGMPPALELPRCRQEA